MESVLPQTREDPFFSPRKPAMVESWTDVVPEELLEPAGAGERAQFLDDEYALLIDQWLGRLARREHLCRQLLGRLARWFMRKKGHERLGFARLDDYARERLGLSGREVRSLAAVEGRLNGLRRVDAAFSAGELSWSKVRLLAAIATRSDEEEWLGRARTMSVRALQRAVREAREQGAERASSGVGLAGENRRGKQDGSGQQAGGSCGAGDAGSAADGP